MRGRAKHKLVEATCVLVQYVAGMVISVDAVCPFVVGVCGARCEDVGTTATGVYSKFFEGVR